ncbi:MAG TPA: carbohydrate binding domain-containing protein [Pseudobacteroides sp.]|uniref:carbohydrate binding domain-containing protein n=1 Tax=Pseudobacteroides sp. TaxID=1968840 RepID=UPI002F941601
MKKIVTILIMIILAFSAVSAYAEGNLLLNPSFEEVTGENPTGWEPWGYNGGSVFKVEEGEGHSGKKFVSITSESENDARYKQTVAVKENSTYKLSCWVKTENVGADKTGAIISLLDYVYSSKDLKGTNDKWEYTEMYFKPGKGVMSVVVTVSLGGHGNMNKGKAYFDDLTMEEVASVPSGAKVAPIEGKAPAENPASETGKSSNTGTIIIIIIVALIVIGLIIYIVFVSSRSGKAEKDNDEDQYCEADNETKNDEDYDDYE